MKASTSRNGVILAVVLFLVFALPVVALSATPQELFERAETLYRQLEVVDPSGQAPSWDRVADAFNDFAMRYPDSPLASEALWRVSWIHGRRARTGDGAAHARQLEIYRDLVQRYPTSPHAPEALLRLAVEAESEGGVRAASLYARLLQTYPATPQATLARNRMNELLRANPDLDTSANDAAGVAETTAPAVGGGASASGAARDEATSVDRAGAPDPDAATSAAGTSTAGDPLDNPAMPTDPIDIHDLARLTGVRHYSDRAHTRVVLDLDRPVRFETGEAHQPDRLFLDLQGVSKPGELAGASDSGLEQVISVDGDAVSRVRVGVNQPGVVRVVVDLGESSRHTLFTLDDKDDEPFRIVIDVPTATVASRVNANRRPPEGDHGSISEQLALGVRRIVLDPGHGGTDPGAIGRSGVTEKQLTLQIAQTVGERLRAAGYEVILTRDEDRTVSLQERTDYANSVDADLFLSIHVNSARNRGLRGFETYYLNLANDPTAAETAARENASGTPGRMGDLDKTLELIVQNEFQGASSELAASIQDSLVMHVAKGYEDVHDLGVKTAPFFVLVGATMPAVLIETSFVSNEQEEAWLKTDGYREQLAEAIEIGLQSYVDKRRSTVTTSRR
jgi:N-acetylmuramoyl-L-alanine amidase